MLEHCDIVASCHKGVFFILTSRNFSAEFCAPSDFPISDADKTLPKAGEQKPILTPLSSMRDREHDDLSSKNLLALHSIEDAEPKFHRAFKIEVEKGISANANILSLAALRGSAR